MCRGRRHTVLVLSVKRPSVCQKYDCSMSSATHILSPLKTKHCTCNTSQKFDLLAEPHQLNGISVFKAYRELGITRDVLWLDAAVASATSTQI